MLIVTNGIEQFKVAKKTLWNRKTPVSGLATKLNFEYWGIELVFIISKNKKFDKILKCLPDGDVIEEYKNLDTEKKNFILLSDENYFKVKKMYMAMQDDRDYEKEALIEGLANILSFDFFQSSILEDEEVSLEILFKDIFETKNRYKNYKEEIFKRTMEILKTKYKVTKKII